MTDICNLLKGLYPDLIECAVYSVGGVAHAVVVNIATLAQHQSRHYRQTDTAPTLISINKSSSRKKGVPFQTVSDSISERGGRGDRQKPAATVM